MGLELQLEELREQQERARVQGRDSEAVRLQSEIEELQSELATTAELAAEMATAGEPDAEPPHLHGASKLSLSPPA